MDQLIFLKSNFGINPTNKKESHPVLLYQNHQFWWKKDNDDGSSRYCCSEKNTQFKCPASITIKSSQAIRYNDNHTHREQREESIKTYIAYQNLKEEISTDISKSIKNSYNETQRLLIQDNVPERAVAALFPSYSTANNTLYKKRASKRPPIPTDFSKLTITGDYTQTSNNQPFLRYDNKSSTSRILIFVDDECLKYLSESKLWFMDGTFKSSPEQFLQIYTIHAFVYNTSIPCVYILSQKKNEATYREAIGSIKDLAKSVNLNLNPETVMADFENASTNAMSHHFPNVTIKGCWFHFKKAIFAKATKIGLKQHYHKTDYREFVNLFGALALVPIEKISDGMETIKSLMPDDSKCTQLYNYFDNNWIKSKF